MNVNQTRLLFDAEKIPRELRALPQWVAYRMESRDGKVTKVPYRAHGVGKAMSNAPATWATFEAATLACEYDKTLAGVGFVFSAEDPYVGIDLDHCVENGELAVWALKIVRDLCSYCEWSRSGDGLHIIARGKLAARGIKRAVQGAARADAAIEMYDHGRYFVVTGNRYGDGFATIEKRQVEIDALQATHVAGQLPVFVTPLMTVAHIIPNDCVLLERARAAQNGSKFIALFDRGDTSGYNGDHSAADAALCARLVFWTGRDAGRVDRLFRCSKLMRYKWDERHSSDGRTYGQMTVDFAIANCREVYEAVIVQPTHLDMFSAISTQAIRDAIDTEVRQYRRSLRLADGSPLSVGQINGIRARVSRRFGIILPPIAVSA